MRWYVQNFVGRYFYERTLFEADDQCQKHQLGLNYRSGWKKLGPLKRGTDRKFSDLPNGLKWGYDSIYHQEIINYSLQQQQRPQFTSQPATYMFTVSTSLLLNQVKLQLHATSYNSQHKLGRTRKILVPYFYWEWTIEINREKEQQTGTASQRKKKKKRNSFAPKSTPMMDRDRQYPRLTRIDHNRATALLRLQKEQRFLWPRWRWTIRNQSKQPSNDTIASKKQKSQSAHNMPWHKTHRYLQQQPCKSRVPSQPWCRSLQDRLFDDSQHC